MCYGTLEIWVWKDGEPELWTEGNGHLPWGKAKPNLKGCGAKEEEKEDEEEEEDKEEGEEGLGSVPMRNKTAVS